MKTLKFSLYALTMVSLFVFSSCADEDEDCTAPAVSANIVGTWAMQTGETVEFKADGTLVDPDEGIIGGEINGEVLDQKTYTVSGTVITATAMSSSNNANFVEADFNVVTNECNSITIEVVGLEELGSVSMTRQ